MSSDGKSRWRGPLWLLLILGCALFWYWLLNTIAGGK